MSPQEIPRYPFRRIGAAEKPTPKVLRSLARPETASGRPETRLRLSRSYLDREKKLAVTEKSIHGVRPPRWLLARIERHAPVGVVVDDLLKRLRRAPSAKNIRFTQCGLNELGRRRGGGKLLRRTITQQLFDEFQAKWEG